MDSGTIQPPADPTDRPQEIDVDDFRMGYQMGRVASSLNVLDSITGRPTHSLRMGYMAYQALLNNEFPNIDYIRAAEFAEWLGLGKR